MLCFSVKHVPLDLDLQGRCSVGEVQGLQVMTPHGSKKHQQWASLELENIPVLVMFAQLHRFTLKIIELYT